MKDNQKTIKELYILAMEIANALDPYPEQPRLFHRAVVHRQAKEVAEGLNALLGGPIVITERPRGTGESGDVQ